MRTIWFDMDGTISNLYAVKNWLDKLINSDPSPYKDAKIIYNMSILARYLNKLQSKGYGIGIISWLSKNSTENYDIEVTAAKMQWLKQHIPSVKWDVIHIVKYGTPKQNFRINKNDILFDDEINNRIAWGTKAYEPNQIFQILKELNDGA